MSDKLFYFFWGLTFGLIIILCLTINQTATLHENVESITELNQKQFWIIQGLEQQVKQYEQDPYTHIIIDNSCITQSSSDIKSSN